MTILINDPGRTQSVTDISINVFDRIFSVFTSLVELDFGSGNRRRFHARLKLSNLSSKMCVSSSLVRLRISVDTFDDCLCLLDGRLTHLSQLVVRISEIRDSRLSIDSTVSISI